MNPEPNQPVDPTIRINVTFTLSRQFVWLLAGIVIGNLQPPGELLNLARALLSG
jgi:hypothetical protein